MRTAVQFVPIVTTVIALAFAGVVLGRWMDRRQPHLLVPRDSVARPIATVSLLHAVAVPPFHRTRDHLHRVLDLEETRKSRAGSATLGHGSRNLWRPPPGGL